MHELSCMVEEDISKRYIEDHKKTVEARGFVISQTLDIESSLNLLISNYLFGEHENYLHLSENGFIDKRKKFEDEALKKILFFNQKVTLLTALYKDNAEIDFPSAELQKIAEIRNIAAHGYYDPIHLLDDRYTGIFHQKSRWSQIRTADDLVRVFQEQAIPCLSKLSAVLSRELASEE